MQTAYIKFLTEEDRVRGFYELIKSTRVNSFPGQIYNIPLEALSTLENLHINYRRATDDEVKTAHDSVRNPAAAVL